MRVTDYRVYWNMTLDQGSLELHLEDGSRVTLSANEAGKLIIWVDLLRTESPVFYWKTEESEGLSSGWEVAKDPPKDYPGRFPLDGQE